MNVALCPEDLNILSLCTGGGGLDIGIELAIPGARSVCMVEREAFAVAQLVSAMEAGLLAPAPVWSDARTFDGRAWRGCVDGLIGGIPCQPHSLAGQRKGQDDERDLWSTARRIVVQSGAWFVLIENVGGMLSSGGAERVWRDLRRLGVAVEGGLFTAAEVGASHERERLFILAVAEYNRRFPQGRPAKRGETQGRQSHDQSSGSGSGLESPSTGVADTNGERLEGPRPYNGEIGREDARGPAGLCDGTALVHAKCTKYTDQRYERHRDNAMCGRHEFAQQEIRARRNPTFDAGQSMADPSIARSGPVSVQPGRQDEADGDTDGPGVGRLFPPGPSDRENWQAVLERAPELEPAFRRVADGLASPLDIARVDRLRLLGNGVVPLQAAYAVRTLAARLAESGSPSAARLVRMMEAAE